MLELYKFKYELALLLKYDFSKTFKIANQLMEVEILITL